MVVVERPRPRGSWLRAPLERLGVLLTAPRIRLDERGSFVWKRLDGARTVAELAAELRASFGESVEPAEERLGELVRQLRRARLVTYHVEVGRQQRVILQVDQCIFIEIGARVVPG